PFGRGADALIFGWLFPAACATSAASCLARACLVAAERRAWLMLGTALTASAAGNVLFAANWYYGLPTHLASSVVVSVAYLLGLGALVTVIRIRLPHVSIAAWLDGVIGAFVIEAFVALAF